MINTERGGDTMTSAERNCLEQKLFAFTRTNSQMYDEIQQLYKAYSDVATILNSVHEAQFGKKYCRMILKYDAEFLPTRQQICNYTGEKTASYYLYRRQILETIAKRFKEKGML